MPIHTLPVLPSTSSTRFGGMPLEQAHLPVELPTRPHHSLGGTLRDYYLYIEDSSDGFRIYSYPSLRGVYEKYGEIGDGEVDGTVEELTDELSLGLERALGHLQMAVGSMHQMRFYMYSNPKRAEQMLARMREAVEAARDLTVVAEKILAEDWITMIMEEVGEDDAEDWGDAYGVDWDKETWMDFWYPDGGTKEVAALLGACREYRTREEAMAAVVALRQDVPELAR